MPEFYTIFARKKIFSPFLEEKGADAPVSYAYTVIDRRATVY